MWLWMAGEALARAGGGHSFSGGGGGFSGGGGGGGGSGLVELVIWLVFAHPTVGVPLLVVGAVVFVLHVRAQQGPPRAVVRSRPRARTVDLSALRAADPTFSPVLFLDWVRLVYTRAQEERGRKNLDVLAAVLTPRAVQALARGEGPVQEVVVGAAHIDRASVDGGVARLIVALQANYTQAGARFFTMERWTFAREADAPSPGPEQMRSLACPSCGSPLETRRDGRCTNCDTPLADGRHLWRVENVAVEAIRRLQGLELALGGGLEVGTDHPHVEAPDLAAQLRALQARHPEFARAAFLERATAIFLAIQAAWSAGRWEQARPLETDALYQQHRYWMDRYAASKLRNRCEDVRVTDTVIVRVGLDAFYESITVRIFARMLDWTEDATGRVVGGSRDEPRVFSEYWTFVRAAGAPLRSAHDVAACPSCGAPLDRMGETGVCGYCDAKVTGGEFDWVAAMIDQDEVYVG
jgi:predicted lipid-binding transport protein (Tim44 family)/uncharacterized Zn finger protein (UPF0148 family)